MASAISRIGGIIMPYIGINLMDVGTYFPYLLFGIASLLAGFFCILLPYDTTNRELDVLEDDDLSEKSELIDVEEEENFSNSFSNIKDNKNSFSNKQKSSSSFSQE